MSNEPRSPPNRADVRRAGEKGAKRRGRMLAALLETRVVAATRHTQPWLSECEAGDRRAGPRTDV